MRDLMQLVQICKGRNIYIQTHNFPDPDAIASAFGLQRLLQKFDVDSTLCYAGRIDKLSAYKMLDVFAIKMYSYEELSTRMRQDDAIICVDSQKNGGNITDFIGDEIACIDHHPTFVEVKYEYSDIYITGACASIIADYYRELDIVPDKDVATALMYGLRMDTLQFSRGVTPLDIKMFGYLFPYSDPDVLAQLERNNLELKDLQAYGAAIDSITIFNKVGFVSIPFSCPDGLIGALSDFVLALEEVLVAIVLCKREDGIKFSVRSEIPGVHAGHLTRAALAGYGDGGGHQAMAGGLVRNEQLDSLGQFVDDFFRERFLEELDKLDK